VLKGPSWPRAGASDRAGGRPGVSLGHLSQPFLGPFWPVLAVFGGLRGHRPRAPSGARRGPRAAALPRRGSPGPVGARRCDLRAAAGAVGRQGAVCPRLAGAGPRGEVPVRSTPRQLVETARNARAVPGRRSDPPYARSRRRLPRGSPAERSGNGRSQRRRASECYGSMSLLWARGGAGQPGPPRGT
jgi:hypothetical protein